METPKSTKDIGSLIQTFFAAKDITIERCDALEVAAKIQGYRDLHENQQIASVQSAPKIIPNDEMALFFNALALQIQSGLPTVSAVANCEGMLPQKMIERMITGLESGDRFGDTLLKLGFPRYLVAVFISAESHRDYSRAFEQVAQFVSRMKTTFAFTGDQLMAA